MRRSNAPSSSLDRERAARRRRPAPASAGCAGRRTGSAGTIEDERSEHHRQVELPVARRSGEARLAPAAAARRRTSPSARRAATKMPTFSRSSSGRERLRAAAPAGRGGARAAARRAPAQLHHRDRGEAQHAGQREEPAHADPAGRAAARRPATARTCSPIVEPIIAIALVRCCSRVRSAASAITTDEIAPAPCSTRPAIDDPDVVARRRRGSCRRRRSRARRRSPACGPSGRRPCRTDLQDRLREAVGAERDADQREVVAAGELRRVDREHRQDDEQPEHAQAEDAQRGSRRRAARAGSCDPRSHVEDGVCGGKMGNGAIVASFALPHWTSYWTRIRIRGARTHNLKNINLDLPRNRLVVITGLSGSGKISLAFDTLYAEGQRRYVESLSAYARQFLQLMEKPDVDLIEGLSPAISIEQKATSTTRARPSARSPRSTTTCACCSRASATPYCPEHDLALHGADRLADGRPRARAARGHAADDPRAGGRRPQGRAGRAVRRAARAGLRARARRRHGARARPAAEARRRT